LEEKNASRSKLQSAAIKTYLGRTMGGRLEVQKDAAGLSGELNAQRKKKKTSHQVMTGILESA